MILTSFDVIKSANLPNYVQSECLETRPQRLAYSLSLSVIKSILIEETVQIHQEIYMTSIYLIIFLARRLKKMSGILSICI